MKHLAAATVRAEGDYVGELDANGLRCGSGKMAWKYGA
eukprot:CAMPEP_0201912542 /NCGR_PEP_ID=MMETSP0903-20130614/3185_1 /ASSEMBLY_ACC=CAM_ASM_000552 /TAXON_ID=420261 /ORGANISM="Thalassiosira antarctica, Strain CCMP982" /LENGTH=37 /DNA_ID= /DNA_START= /DNA_END= /DNA_ORIENTATION=